MKPIEKDYKKAVHFRPMKDNGNVRCLNGSAHINASYNIEDVTCEKCLNPDTHKNYWDEKLTNAGF